MENTLCLYHTLVRATSQHRKWLDVRALAAGRVAAALCPLLIPAVLADEMARGLEAALALAGDFGK